jgi:hypothetical protein
VTLIKRQPPMLTEETIRTILAKEALLKAGVSPPTDEVTSSNTPFTYVVYVQPWADFTPTAYYSTPVSGEEDSAYLTMLASESVLRQDWDSPEEDEAWAHL